MRPTHRPRQMGNVAELSDSDDMDDDEEDDENGETLRLMNDGQLKEKAEKTRRDAEVGWWVVS